MQMPNNGQKSSRYLGHLDWTPGLQPSRTSSRPAGFESLSLPAFLDHLGTFSGYTYWLLMLVIGSSSAMTKLQDLDIPCGARSSKLLTPHQISGMVFRLNKSLGRLRCGQLQMLSRSSGCSIIYHRQVRTPTRSTTSFGSKL